MQRPFCFLWSDAARNLSCNCICCFVFFGRSTLRPYMPTYQYGNIPTYPHVVIITKVADANLKPKSVIILFCANERFGLNNSNYYCIFVVGKVYC